VPSFLSSSAFRDDGSVVLYQQKSNVARLFVRSVGNFPPREGEGFSVAVGEFAVPQMPRPGHQKRHGAEEQSLFACDMLVIGDKGRSQMKRADAGSIKRSATDIVAPGTFALASGLASELMSAGAAQEYDAVVMVYNEFVNAATYKQMYKIIKPFKTETEDGQDILATYEFEPDEKSAALVDMEKLKKQRRDKGLSKKRG
jgi:hypothetical protein